ncbi:uncharacterized protein N7459_009917 [Penicillium hispanicum]|uniref:uncharacterized protein n=1 Tax=Penicillium hispanicum TaxID=1080232 RepID=UPI002540CC9C|nr:uncharacterized protein N7459_009917 [Penicillium hispanicum]KAJ5570487.1 hypothetical protein N7459_009917 [Penicillium hispanicum]
MTHIIFLSKWQKFSSVDRQKISHRNICLPGPNRHDTTPDLTILRCTLFPRVSFHQEFAVESRMVDFKDILRCTVDDHITAHEADLEWLNTQVSAIAKDEPQRRIVIFTYHSPSVDTRCMDPTHSGSDVSMGFVTDLSREEYCTNPAVTAWAFVHTHFSCAFTDTDGKAIIFNQKGYRLVPVQGFNAENTWTFGEYE